MAICALVVAGFWPSYFSKLFSAQSQPLTVLVHGALMTAWVALFIVQVSLVTMGRVDLHRRLGVLGFALLALILIVAVPTTIVATKLGGHHMPGPALPGLVHDFAYWTRPVSGKWTHLAWVTGGAAV
jgi:hypothetical protein